MPWHYDGCQAALEGTCQQKKKREELGVKYKKMYWLMGRRCHINPLTPNDPYTGRTAPLTSKVAFCIFIQQI